MWHRTSEIPESYTDIILTDGNNVDTGHYGDYGFTWNGIQYNKPTHWIKPSDLLTLPIAGFEARVDLSFEEDIENSVVSVVADVTQLEDETINIGAGGGIPDERDLAYIRLVHLVLQLTHKLFPEITNYDRV